jgi:hypothetical protein
MAGPFAVLIQQIKKTSVTVALGNLLAGVYRENFTRSKTRNRKQNLTPLKNMEYGHLFPSVEFFFFRLRVFECVKFSRQTFEIWSNSERLSAKKNLVFPLYYTISNVHA